MHINRRMLRDDSDESEASSVCSERSMDSFRRNDVSCKTPNLSVNALCHWKCLHFYNICSHVHRGMDPKTVWIGHFSRTSTQLSIIVRRHIGPNAKMVLLACRSTYPKAKAWRPTNWRYAQSNTQQQDAIKNVDISYECFHLNFSGHIGLVPENVYG